jgi:hypothetical protein
VTILISPREVYPPRRAARKQNSIYSSAKAGWFVWELQNTKRSSLVAWLDRIESLAINIA